MSSNMGLNLIVHQDIIFWLYITMGCPGILLNITALIVLFKVKKGELGHHLSLLKSLAFSDLLVCMLGVLEVLWFYTLSNNDDRALLTNIFEQCKFAYIATFLNLVLIAVNQYIAVMKPLRYNQLVTRRRMVAALVTIWILAVLLSSIDLLHALTLRPESFREFRSLFDEIDPRNNFTQVVWKMFTAIIFIGSVVLCVLYIRIYQAARRNLRQTDALNQVQIQQHKERRHSVNTSLLLLGTFLLVYVPFCAVYIAREYLVSSLPDTRNLEEWLEQIEQVQKLQILAKYMEPILMMNSISDPLIYMLRLDTIKQTIKQIMCACKPCKSSSISVSEGISHGHHHVHHETQL